LIRADISLHPSTIAGQFQLIANRAGRRMFATAANFAKHAFFLPENANFSSTV
jgi:hypothetical protein